MITYSLHTFAELTSLDLFEILKLRQDIFIVEQDCAYPDIDEDDLTSHHVVGKNKVNQVVSYARILSPHESNGPTSEYVSIGRIVVHADVRGKGVGGNLVTQSITYTKNLYPSSRIKISAQRHLQPFYRQVGFKTVGQSYFEDGIPHVRMEYEEEE